MRVFLGLILLLVALLAAAWLSGETLLARRATDMIARDPRIAAASVAPLREVYRIGLELRDVAIETDQGPAALPDLALWAEPTQPNRFHATLPPRMTLPVAGQPREVTAQGADLSLRVSPANALSLTEASVVSGPVAIAGQPLADSLDLRARMVPLGAGAPPEARAAYRVTADLQGIAPAAVQPGLAAVLPGAIGVQGVLRVFLDGPVGRATMRNGTAPQLQGLHSDGITVTLGALSARIIGQVAADAQGRAAGQLHVYTRDARALLELAAAAGAFPPAMVTLATTVLTNLGREADPEAPPPADRSNKAAAGIADGPPPPEEGELRLPLLLQDGRVSLGPLPLGPAPRLH
ncbi:DUF2125 domain-containing protein [uncultured Paracoccus sp.]|uniref:DUF2125 domain-containing protein n=1 Tax=uncultured Paracoccus sp. TaxID=189685 RepID=UPI0026240A6A|nr:DUF2125 domain-containing protein [uncultured Paracoccus sp.]